jgi:23S rRNA (cytidine1920-2'-O)/16S rRNA (cytidine1409-2'-O)-methyltransferase
MPVPKKPVARRRIDLMLVENGLAENQARAQALVLAGKVTAAGHGVAKPGTLVPGDAALAVSEPEPFVGRGGLKLEHALDAFGIETTGKVAIDIGASTGGFTDCLLQRGAARVYAIDVGKGQLDWRLRQDPRVVVVEGVNARYPLTLPEVADIATIDVSFISVTRVIPSAADAIKPGGDIVVLVKPQFEAQRREVGKGGIVSDPVTHARVLGRVVLWSTAHDFRLRGLVASPITGASGNREFFVLIRRVHQEPTQARPKSPSRFDPVTSFPI